MYAFDPVLRRGRNQATRGEVFRRACELCRSSGRAVAAKEEDDRRPPIRGAPGGREEKVDLQISGGVALYATTALLPAGRK